MAVEKKNEKGEKILDIARCGITSLQDYIMLKQSKVKFFKDCTVIPGSGIASRPRIVLLDKWKRNWGEIKSQFRDEVEWMSIGRVKEGDVEKMWQGIKNIKRTASREVLGKEKTKRVMMVESTHTEEASF